MLKPYIEFNKQKSMEEEKNNDKDKKRVVQINEQCYIWKSNRKYEKGINSSKQ